MATGASVSLVAAGTRLVLAVIVKKGWQISSSLPTLLGAFFWCLFGLLLLPIGVADLAELKLRVHCPVGALLDDICMQKSKVETPTYIRGHPSIQWAKPCSKPFSTLKDLSETPLVAF